MTLGQQIQSTLTAISDETLRDQVRYDLARRVYSREGWVVPIAYDREWAIKAIIRILKGKLADSKPL
jgi:hypothetical protein